MYASDQGTLFSPGPEFLRSYHINYSIIRCSMLTTITSLGVKRYCRFVMDHNCRGVGAGGQGGQSPPHFSRRGGIAPPLLESDTN